VDLVRTYRGTEPYEKALRKRAVWVEPLFGEAKQWHRLVSFRLRMLEKVNIEGLMVASGQNIKRLMAARGWGPRDLAQAAVLPLPPNQHTSPAAWGAPARTVGLTDGEPSGGWFESDPRVFQQAGSFYIYNPDSGIH
jgi:hypothetical protein